MTSAIVENYLSKLSDNQKLFVWLYCPLNFIPIKSVINEFKNYDLPYSILFKKIILNLHTNKYSPDDIINFFLENNLIKNPDIPKLIKLYNESIKLLPHKLTLSKIKCIIVLSNYVPLKNSKMDHQGYPQPDPVKGRPFLNWKECYFNNCHTKFKTIMDLKNHLNGNGKLRHGLHQFHEYVVKSKKLTKEYIINNKITKCPSFICDKADHTFTPEELCDHFTILGITPFWYPNCDISNLKQENTELYGYYKSIFSADECIICLDNSPNIISYPCQHYIMCWECYLKLQTMVCPVCKNQIKFVVPF